MTRFWARIRAVVRRALEKTFVENPAQWLVEMFGGRSAATGVTVNETTAMGLPAYFAAVAAPSETIASLPLFVYRRHEDGGKAPDPKHPLAELLHLAPNPEMTAMMWREMTQVAVYNHGNGYSEIVRDGAGRVRELWPIPPQRMRVERLPTGALDYVVSVPGGTVSAPGSPIRRPSEAHLAPNQVVHLRALSLDGVLGVSRLRLHRESIGLALALEEYGARFFGNDATPSGTLEHPGTLGKEGRQNLRESIEQEHLGLERAHRLMILEEGMKFHEIGLANEKAQFLQSRQFQIGEMGRIARVPGVVIGHDDKTATYASAEQFFLAYVVHTIRPSVVRWEQTLMLALLTPAERRTHLIEHKLDGLLRGDTQTRYAAYAIGRQWGWLSADDIRALENMNPLPDGQGRTYLTPLNMTPSGSEGASPRDGGPRRLTLIAQEAVGRLVRREGARVRDAALKCAAKPTDWRAWVEGFYREHAELLADALQLEPAWAAQYADRHRAALLQEGVAVCARWEREAPGELLAAVLDGAAPASSPIVLVTPGPAPRPARVRKTIEWGRDGRPLAVVEDADASA